MYSMKKIMVEGSHFQLVNEVDLEYYNVIQIWPNFIYKDDFKRAVFLCEVVDTCDACDISGIEAESEDIF